MADRTKDALNAANLKMRSQPWYQQWFQSKGLNPNMVQLSDAQRKELANVAAQNGMPLGSGEMIDPAGNFHTQTGFAGWPTWAKIAAVAAPAAAVGLATGGLGDLGLFGAGGSSGAAAGTGAGITGVAAPITGATLGGGGVVAGGGGSALGGLFAGSGSFGDILKYGTGPISGMVTGIYGARTQANAANHAGDLQAQAAMHGADLTAAAAQKALEFQQQQEATRKAEWEKTQAQNLDFYNQAQARLTPYRNMGLGALSQLRRPIGA